MRRPDDSAYIRILDADGKELLALDASDSSQVLFKTEDITINEFGNLDWELMAYIELDEGVLLSSSLQRFREICTKRFNNYSLCK